MHSSKVELGDLPSNNEIKDDNVSCIKLSSFNEEQYNLGSFQDETVNADLLNQHANVSYACSSGNLLHTLSSYYAQLLITITSTVMFSELLHQRLALFFIHDYLFLYLLGIGILLLAGAIINRLRDQFFQANIRDLVEMPQYVSKKLEEVNQSNINKYFKAGIYVFGLGVFISSLLETISIFTSPIACIKVASASQSILRCVFNGLQIAFFFMSSKEIWNIFGCIRNLAFMHLLATNVAIWIRILLWESTKDWEMATHVKHNSSLKWGKNEVDLNITVHALELDFNSNDTSKHTVNHVIHYASACWWRVQKSNEVDVISVQTCLENSTIGTVWAKTTEFLYPIVAQYYLIIFCVIYTIWINFNTIKNCNHFTKKCKKESFCSQSTKGLFLGLVVLMSSIIVLIIYFARDNESKQMVRILYCIVFGSSLFASFLGIIQSRKMSAKIFKGAYYDSIIQKSGLFVVYVYGSCNILSGATSNEIQSYIICVEAIFMVLHACLQNLFVMQMLHKKIDDSNICEKPARQAIAYLILCNISLWILECFVSWNLVKKDIQIFTFGNIAWPLITRIIFPFLVFYRYHSFILLIKLWKKSYC